MPPGVAGNTSASTIMFPLTLPEQGVMRFVLLRNGDFRPYWKLLAHEFGKQVKAARHLSRRYVLMP